MSRGWQHWGCLGVTKYWDDPPHVWYYRDYLGNFWVVRCHACRARQRMNEVASLSDDD